MMISFYYNKVSAGKLAISIIIYNLGYLVVPLLYYTIDKATRELVFLGWEVKQRLKYKEAFLNVLPVGVLVTKESSISYTNLALRKLLSMEENTSPSTSEIEQVKITNFLRCTKKREAELTLFDVLNSEEVISDIKGEKFDFYVNPEKSIPLGVSTMKLFYGSDYEIIVALQDLSIYEELETKRNLLECQKAFFAMITHELRNPLHGIMGMLELIKMGDISEQCNKDCTLGMNTGKLMMCLINDILDFSQMEANKFKLNEDLFSPIEALNDCLEVMQFRFKEKNVQLRKVVIGEIPETIQNDKNRFKQIIFNLLGNAIKFTCQGYTEIEIAYDKENKKLKAKVSDTGIGIKEEEKCQIFQMYGTLTSQKRSIHKELD